MKKRKTTKAEESVASSRAALAAVQPIARGAAAAGKKKNQKQIENDENRPLNAFGDADSADLPDSTVINYSRPGGLAGPNINASKPLKSVNFTPAAIRFSTLNPLNPSVQQDQDDLPIQSFQSRFSDFHGNAENDSAGLIRKLVFTTKDCQTPGRYDARQKQTGQPMQVFLRIRPILEFDQLSEEAAERQEGENTTNTANTASFIKLDDDNSVTLSAPKDSTAYRSGEKESKFSFSKVFSADTTQEEIFNTAVLPVVDAFYTKGTNGLIFAYGITNSGKSYTMQGTASQPGIIPRVICSVFEKIFTNQKSSDRELEGIEGSARDSLLSDNGLNNHEKGSLMPHFSMQISFLEIYNERIFDLLATQPNANNSNTQNVNANMNANVNGNQMRQECKLQHTKNDEVYVSGLREVSIANHKEALLILQQGLMNRKVGETLLNSDSSRSHSVFTIKLITPDGQVWSRLSIVDLAGSERTKRTQHNEAGGSTKLREAVNINTSLLVLGRCLESLRWNQMHPKLKPKQIPFRESKITRLFRDSLTGWGRTVMICNTSQNPADYDENIHALKYAAIAREIRVMPRVDSTNPQYLQANRDRANAAKRLAEKPLPELDNEHNSSIDDVDLELQKAAQRSRHAAAGATKDGILHDDGEVDTLLDQIFHLKQLLVATEAKCAEIDTAVRTECVNEMEEQAKQLELLHEQNLVYEKQRIQALWDRKFALFKAEMEEKVRVAMESASKGSNNINGGVDSQASNALSNGFGVSVEMELEIERLRGQLRDVQGQYQAKCDELHHVESEKDAKYRLAMEQHTREMDNVKGLMADQMKRVEESNRLELDRARDEIQLYRLKYDSLQGKYEELKAMNDDQRFILQKLESFCDEYNGWKGNNLSLMEFLIQIREFVMENESENENEHSEMEEKMPPASQSQSLHSHSNSVSMSQSQSRSITASQSQSQSHSLAPSDSVDVNYIDVNLSGNPAPEGQRELPKANPAIAKTQPLPASGLALPMTSSNISKTAPAMAFSSPAKASNSQPNSFLAAALAILTKKKAQKSAGDDKADRSASAEEDEINEKEKEKQRKQREKEEKAAKKQAEKEEKERLKAEAKAKAAEEKERKKREKEEKKNAKKDTEFQGVTAGASVNGPILAPRSINVNEGAASLDAEWLDLLSPIRAPESESPSLNLAKGPAAEKKYGAQKGRHRHEASNAPAFQSQSSIPFRGNVLKFEPQDNSFTFYGDDSLQSQESDKENQEDEEHAANRKNGNNRKRSKQNEKTVENTVENNGMLTEAAPLAKRTRGKK